MPFPKLLSLFFTSTANKGKVVLEKQLLCPVREAFPSEVGDTDFQSSATKLSPIIISSFTS